MKKIYLLFKTVTAMLLTAMIGISGVNAQDWDAPSFVGEAPTSGTAYYIYNLGSNGFLNQGGNWGTQAAVSPSPRKGADMVSWTSVNTSGSVWTFQLTKNGAVVTDDYIASKDEDGGTIYTDQFDGDWNNSWTATEVDAVNHVYSFQVPDTYTSYSADAYMGSKAAAEATGRGIANVVTHNITSNDDYIKWIFVSQDNYDLYHSKVVLDRYLTYAKAKGGIDLTDYLTAYNSDIIADINTASGNLLTALGRTDVSSSVVDASFEDGSGSFSVSWTNNGFAIQNNDPGQTWTKDGTYYAEKYTGANGSLGSSTVTQTITGLANGMYELVVNAHAVQQGGANPLHTGAFAKCGTSLTEISAGMDDYVVSHAFVSNGELTIGYVLQGEIACNWTGFDNFRLYYYGESSVSADATLSSVSLSEGTLIPGFDSGTTSYVVSIPVGTESVDVTPTKSDVNASIDLGNGPHTVTITDGVGSIEMVVTAEDGETQLTYSIKFKEECFSEMYPGVNLIGDPILSSISNFGGWGTTSINTDFDYTYCGPTSGKVTTSGSIDVSSITFVPEQTYLLKAMIYVESGQFRIGIDDGVGSEMFGPLTTQNGVWEELDTLFMTTASAATGVMYFNNYSLDGTIGYIDNWELYNVNEATLSDLSIDGATITDFSPSTLQYEYAYPKGTNPTLLIEATSVDENATVVVSDITDGIATVVVTGPTGIELTYTVNFVQTDVISEITFTEGVILMPEFDGNTNSYVASVPAGVASVDVTVVLADENATTNLTDNTQAVALTDGVGSISIVVTLADGVTQLTYTIDFKEECFTEMYPGFNLVGDPTVSDLGNFGGWGTQSINTDFDYTYCGPTSGKIGPDDAGSIDVNPISFVAEGIYQLKAQVYVEEGTFRIGMDDGSGSETFVTMSTLNQQWETIDTVFQATSGAGNGLMYFNNWSLNGTTGYIDNWEMYNVTEATLTDLQVNGETVANFSPADLTYDYYYAFGTTPTIAITATAATEGITPVITEATEYPGSATVEVTGPNGITLTYTINFIEEAIVSDITLSEGMILIPAFDAKTSSYIASVPAGVTSVDVTVALVDENATTNLSSNPETVAIVDGLGSIEIIVTSADEQTVLTYNIEFKEECFSDMYPGFNLISDPTVSDLDNFGGWGTQSLNTDLDYTYCGVTSGKIGPNGEGSIDVNPISFVAEGIYQLKAQVYVEEGTFRIGMDDGSGSETFVTMSTLNQQWETIDTLFQATSGAGNGGLMYFNNWQLSGTVGYIDNWEMYDVTEATLTDLTVNGTTIADFSPAVLTYDYYYEAGTTPTFEVDATKADANAFMMTVNGSVPGSTTLSLEGVNGIELTYTINFMEDGATNTDKLDESVIKVYPTVSASGEFTVETSGSASVVTVYDLSGKVVSQQNAAAATQKVNVNAKGIYILKVECDGKVEVFKVFNN